MTTTTARGLSRRTAAAAVVSVDEPEFSVEFRAERRSSVSNSFFWSGPGVLRIGPYGVAVSARRRGLLWLLRKQRRFIPSSEIHNVYRERDAIRVELSRDGLQPRFFQFWTGDLKAAATIVALLPTSSTVEFEEAGEPEERFCPPAQGNSRWAYPLMAAIALTTLLVLALLMTLGFVQNPWKTPRSTLAAAAVPGKSTAAIISVADAPRGLSESEQLYARMQFDRFDSRLQGLSTQFGLAFTSLQVGKLTANDFASGLERWQIPQWQTLQTEIEADAQRADLPPQNLARQAMLLALVASASHWRSSLAIYSSGLRAHDSRIVISAFAEMKRAEQAEQLARGRLADLTVPGFTPTQSDPRE